MAQATPATALTAEEVTAMVSGKTLTTQNTRWGTVSLDFRADGRLYGRNNGGSDMGKWKLVEGKPLPGMAQRDYQGCGEVRRSGAEVQHLWPDGRVHFVVR
jgi:hypothetical protein